VIRFFLFLSFGIALFATDLVKYNIYQNPNRVDLMLTFDEPYPGKISKSQTKGSMILALKDVNFPKKKIEKEIDSAFIDSLTIASLKNKILIELKSKTKIVVNASKTIDNTGLRIRIEKESAKKTNDDILMPIQQKSSPQLQSYDFGSSFLKILLTLALLITFLWLLKKWLYKRSSDWLFGKQKSEHKIEILMQRALDMKNRVVLINFEGKKYLLLLGENNLLLDTFSDDEAAFESLLQKNSKKLGDFLQS